MTTNNKKVVDETPPDVPLFLRKTYHMIDSCDPAISCWSDDGETFIVKDPSKFETMIIPQFFKHSKFTSFVRQLNFYSFRKIKYMDTLRLDPKLEAETANYWRFKHDKFQRGKPHLLSEIKRMAGSSKNGTTASKNATATAKTGSSANGAGSEAMKSELDSLKKRIEEMNKNMTQLTSMVQKVTLSSNSQESQAESKPPAVAVRQEPVQNVPLGAKRKKVDTPVVPEAVSSFNQPLSVSIPALPPIQPPDAVGSMEDGALIVRPDEMISSNMDFEEILPMAMDLGTDQVQLQPLDTSDNGAQALDNCYDFSKDIDGDDVALVDICQNDNSTATDDNTATHLLPDPSTGRTPAASDDKAPGRRSDRADPELMDRLSEALAVLPKAMQEQIVERLIAAITTTDLYTAPMPSNVVPSSSQQGEESSMADDSSVSSKQDKEQASGTSPEVAMPLAAATLAALLSHYSEQVKKQSSTASASSCGANEDKAARTGVKHTSVIPVHA